MNRLRRRGTIGSLVLVALAAVVAVITVVMAGREWPDVDDGAWLWLGACAVGVVIGELARVRMALDRNAAPLALALALAAVLTTPSAAPVPAVIHAVVGVAIVVGAGVSALVWRVPTWLEATTEFLMVGAVAALYRVVPMVHGQSLWQWQQGPIDRWIVALAMVGVCVVVVSVLLTVHIVVRGARQGISASGSISDERGDSGRMATAVVSTSILIALTEPAMGLWSLPLFVLPLVLALIAARRFAAVRATYRETISALSTLTEVSGYTTAGHAARVAHLSTEMARALGRPPREIETIEHGALLHDLGQVALREPIPGGATVLAAPTDQNRIADDGLLIISQTGVLDQEATLLRFQTVPYRHVREYGEKVPLGSRIIKVANAYDDLTGGDDQHAATALERINLGLGYEYDPEVVDALTEVLHDREGPGRRVHPPARPFGR